MLNTYIIQIHIHKYIYNTNPDKYIYTGYGIGLNSRSEFLLPDGTTGKNIIIFGADMSSPVHIDNKGKNILILGERPTLGLGDTTLTAEAKYPINFTPKNWFLLKDFYTVMEATVSCLLMQQKYISSQ